MSIAAGLPAGTQQYQTIPNETQSRGRTNVFINQLFTTDMGFQASDLKS
jgi:hypothetical protein